MPDFAVDLTVGSAGFSPFVQERIGWYVYQLRDPRNGSVFYVGKGMGNRVFAHAWDAASVPDSEKPKLAQIQAIHEAGLSVRTELIRHHLPSSATAYLVEAAVIDALKSNGHDLTNAVGGHESALWGLASTDVAASIYDAPQLLGVTEPIVMFKIPQLWTPAMTSLDLYEATRGWWRLGPKARRARYAIAVNRGVTRGVWEIDYWRERVAGDRGGPDATRPRHGFSGSEALDCENWKNKSIKHLKQGSGAIAVYLNCMDDLPVAPLLSGAHAEAAARREEAETRT